MPKFERPSTPIQFRLAPLLCLLFIQAALPGAEDPLLALVRPGMTQAAITDLLKAKGLRSFSSSGAVGALPWAERYRLDHRRSLIVAYGPGDHLLPTMTASVVRIADITDLFPALTGDALADVLTVHDVPSLEEPEDKGFAGDRLLAAAMVLHRGGRARVIAALRHYVEFDKPGSQDLEAWRRHLRRCWETGWEAERVAWLCRLLFVPRDPAKVWEPPGLGGPCPVPTGMVWRTYPLAVSAGLPFLVVDGYELGGQAEPATNWIEFAEKECDLVPTIPPPSLEPIAAAEELIAGPLLARAFGGWSAAYASWMVRRQALTMRLAISHGADFQAIGWSFRSSDADETTELWQRVIALAVQHPLKWDAERLIYVPAP